MKILVISDHEEKILYEYFDPDRWVGAVDLVISCGDLRGDYLSYLVTVLRVPVLYVAGNHDTRYQARPPEGCDDIDGKVLNINGLRIAGLAGCRAYNSGPEEYQFSDRQLRWRVRRLTPAIWRAGGVDLVVSHAAPFRCPLIRRYHHEPAGLGHPCIHPELLGHPDVCPEAVDIVHRGIASYNVALDKWKPRWWVHGHNHLEYGRIPRLWWSGQTQVINGDGHVVIDTEKQGTEERGSIMVGR